MAYDHRGTCPDHSCSWLYPQSFNHGEWESGLTRSVGDILGWSPSGPAKMSASGLNSPNSAPERLGILLMIGALLRARPAGIRPGADPLWIIEEPEAHLHPITLTSMALFVRLIQRQKLFTTYSGDLLSMIPLSHIRRLVRHNGVLYERRVRRNTLSRNSPSAVTRFTSSGMLPSA